MYEDFEVEFRSGVKRPFHETASDIKSVASFYEPSFGRIVSIKRVKAPKAN